MYFIIEVAPHCGRKLAWSSLNLITESGPDPITEVILGFLPAGGPAYPNH
jgi:hypothetical protein